MHLNVHITANKCKCIHFIILYLYMSIPSIQNNHGFYIVECYQQCKWFPNNLCMRLLDSIRSSSIAPTHRCCLVAVIPEKKTVVHLLGSVPTVWSMGLTYSWLKSPCLVGWLVGWPRSFVLTCYFCQVLVGWLPSPTSANPAVSHFNDARQQVVGCALIDENAQCYGHRHLANASACVSRLQQGLQSVMRTRVSWRNCWTAGFFCILLSDLQYVKKTSPCTIVLWA